jgi:hypothetical protein
MTLARASVKTGPARGAIGQGLSQKREQAKEPGEQQDAAIPIPNARRVHDGVQQQARVRLRECAASCL